MPVKISSGLLLTSLVAFSPSLNAGKETLVELARRLAPMPISLDRVRELIPSPFEPMVARADLIVHATIRPIRTYLSADRYELFTDYAVTPLRIMYQRSLQASKTPGSAPPIVLTVWGGRTTLEGVEVTMRDTQAPKLDETSEVVLYLREDGGEGYRLVSDVTGALGVAAGRVQFLNADQAYDDRFRELKGVSVDQLEDRIHRLKR